MRQFFFTTAIAAIVLLSPPVAAKNLDPGLAVQIEQAEYWFSHDDGRGFCADNSGQKLRSRFDETGLTVMPQSSSHRWELGLRTCAIDGEAIQPCRPTAHNEVLTYNHRPGLVEWYENRAGGVKQSFTIERRCPGATGDLQLEIAVAKTGLSVQGGGDSIEFTTQSGSLALRYDELIVFDARGERVPAEMEWQPDRQRIVLAVDDASASYPLLVDPTIGTTQTFEIPLGESHAGQNFGWAVAMSGDQLAVGAPGVSPTGAVYIFRRSDGGSNSWGLVKKIEAPQGAQRFGESVAIDGSLLVVGAPMSDLSELTQNGTTVLVGAGAAYVYRNYGGNAEPWAFVKRFIPDNRAAGGHFGAAVAISGDAALVGAPDHGPGRAFVFESPDSGATWAQVAEIAGDGDPAALAIGRDVDIEGGRAILGAAHSAATGIAYLYERGGGTWPLGHTFVRPDNEPASEGFGNRVRVSGNQVAISSYQGAGTSGQGQIYLYQSTGTGWSPPVVIEDIHGSGDGFAWSIDLAHQQLVIGAPERQNGAFYHYWFVDGVWRFRVAVTRAGSQGLKYGYSVALGSGALAIGTPFENNQVFQDTGVVKVYDVPVRPSSALTSTVADSRFGAAIDVDKDRMVVAAPGDLSKPRAAAYVFERSGTNWQLLAKLDPTRGATDDDGFGSDVSVEGDTVLVGAPLADQPGFLNAGAVHVYTQSPGSPGTWTGRRIDGPAQAGGNFGTSVDLWRGNALIGAPGIDVFKIIGGFPVLYPGAGEVAIHRRDEGGVDQWGRYDAMRAASPLQSAGFGKAIDVDVGLCAIGAPGIGHGTAPEFVHLFGHQSIPDSWQELFTVEVDPGEQSGAGEAVSVSHPYVLIGAPFTDVGQHPSAGAAYLYEATAIGGVLVREFCAPSPRTNGEFGRAVALEGMRSIVGSPGGSNSGRALAFDPPYPADSGAWRMRELRLPSLTTGSGHGSAVALSGGLALVGAPGNSSTGLVHQYELPLVNWDDWVRHYFPLIAGNPFVENRWGFSADPDSDGIPNGLEWAICGDPLEFDRLDFGAENGAGDTLEISFLCSSFPTEGHTLTLLVSTDLEVWSRIGFRNRDGSWNGNAVYFPESTGKTRVRFFHQSTAPRQFFKLNLSSIQ